MKKELFFEGRSVVVFLRLELKIILGIRRAFTIILLQIN